MGYPIMARSIHPNLTPDQIREVVPGLWPTMDVLSRKTENGEYIPTPFYAITQPDGTYGCKPVLSQFHLMTGTQVAEYLADVAELAFGKDSRTTIRQNGAGFKTFMRTTGDVAAQKYQIFGMGTFEPGYKVFDLTAYALREVCTNGMVSPEAFSRSRIINSPITFESKVIQAADALTLHVQRATYWANWVESLETHELSPKDALYLFRGALGFSMNGELKPREQAALDKYLGAYHSAVGAVPGTLRGMVEACTYVISRETGTRNRAGDLVPYDSQDKVLESSRPGSAGDRGVYDSIIRQLSERVELVLN